MSSQLLHLYSPGTPVSSPFISRCQFPVPRSLFTSFDGIRDEQYSIAAQPDRLRQRSLLDPVPVGGEAHEHVRLREGREVARVLLSRRRDAVPAGRVGLGPRSKEEEAAGPVLVGEGE